MKQIKLLNYKEAEQMRNLNKHNDKDNEKDFCNGRSRHDGYSKCSGTGRVQA